jgi:glycosyltransferase involved in cell wall biosynthesis
MTISAFLPVYNEEKRIKYALTSLQWCDEIILLDKTSTDNTVEIAKEFGAKVYVMPNSSSYNVEEFDYFKYCTSEWIILFTASDIIDVGLAYEIKRLINDENFKYDIINVPYKSYILGIENKRSPWKSTHLSSVFRKSILTINKEGVHDAISFRSKKKYSIVNFNIGSIHHLTHETVDSMMDRHIRYWRAEGNNYNESNLQNAFRDLLRAMKLIIWTRKTFLLGWNGMALICAYLSYAMMSFVYKWQNLNRTRSTDFYKKLREDSLKEWDNVKK